MIHSFADFEVASLLHASDPEAFSSLARHPIISRQPMKEYWFPFDVFNTQSVSCELVGKPKVHKIQTSDLVAMHEFYLVSNPR
jgi:hypothetical protein